MYKLKGHRNVLNAAYLFLGFFLVFALIPFLNGCALNNPYVGVDPDGKLKSVSSPEFALLAPAEKIDLIVKTDDKNHVKEVSIKSDRQEGEPAKTLSSWLPPVISDFFEFLGLKETESSKVKIAELQNQVKLLEAQNKSTSSDSSTESKQYSKIGDLTVTGNIDDTSILWKQGDGDKPTSDGNVAVLLPNTYTGEYTVKLLDSDGNEIETASYVGKTNPDRGTYRFDHPGSYYTNPVFLQVGSAIYQVDNPSERHND